MDSNAAEWLENVTHDELQVGQSQSLVRTLTQDDILAFAAVSGDTNPAHLDPEYASHTLFHGVIAHGMWAASLISALLGTRFPGAGTRSNVGGASSPPASVVTDTCRKSAPTERRRSLSQWRT